MVPHGDQICKSRVFSLIEKIKKVNVNEKQIEPFLPGIIKKLESLDREELIKHFVSAEFNRYLSYYKNAKDINFTGKYEIKSGGRGRRGRRKRSGGKGRSKNHYNKRNNNRSGRKRRN